MKAKASWIKKWRECRYCHRTIFVGEKVYKLVGTPSTYIICKSCAEKGGLR